MKDGPTAWYWMMAGCRPHQMHHKTLPTPPNFSETAGYAFHWWTTFLEFLKTLRQTVGRKPVLYRVLYVRMLM